MSGERLAWITGTILIGFAMLTMWREGGANRRRRRNRDAPVEVLAEELKDAWAEYHTP